MRALKRDHLGIDESTDVLSFPIDGRDEVPDGVPRALGDVVLCPQVVGEEWRWPLTHGLLHLLGYEHGDEMEAREAGAARRERRRPPGRLLDSFNYAFEGIIHVLRTQRNMRIHFVDRVRRARRGAGRQRDEARADRAGDLDHVRADRGDAEHRHRGGDRHRDDLVRPDGEAREGHRRRRRADRDRRTRAVGYLVFAGKVADRSRDAARPAARGAGRADARRARADDHHRDRDEGVHGPRHAAARRRAVRAMRRSRSPAGWPPRTSPTRTTAS